MAVSCCWFFFHKYAATHSLITRHQAPVSCTCANFLIGPHGQGFMLVIPWYYKIMYEWGGENICLVNKTDILTNSPSVAISPGAQTLCLPPTGP